MPARVPGPHQRDHALEDYQTSIMLLEQQNKKRLFIARQENAAAVPPPPSGGARPSLPSPAREPAPRQPVAMANFGSAPAFSAPAPAAASPFGNTSTASLSGSASTNVRPQAVGSSESVRCPRVDGLRECSSATSSLHRRSRRIWLRILYHLHVS